MPVAVLAWLADRLAHLLPSRPPGQGGTPPLSLEVRLDAVAAVILDGLSYRRAGRAVGISKTEVGDSMDLLLGELATVGYCQPDGTFITTLADLGQWLEEMARSGEAVVVDGLATRVQRPCGWANQKVLIEVASLLVREEGSASSSSSPRPRGRAICEPMSMQYSQYVSVFAFSSASALKHLSTRCSLAVACSSLL